MGAAGAPSSKTPGWAKQGLYDIVMNPADALNQLGGLGLGGFGDILSGFQNIPSQNIFGPLGQMAGPTGQFSVQGANAGWPLTGQAIQNAQSLFNSSGQLAMPGIQSAADLSALQPQMLAATFPFYNDLKGALDQQMARGPFQGEVAPAALRELGNMNVNGDIYNRAQDLLRPQVRAGFSDRGLGSSGAAIKEEGNQAQQLADTMAQQAAQNRIGYLNAGAAGEGANASMTGALSNILNSVISGSLGGMTAPGQIFNQFEQGTGLGLQNIFQPATQMAGLNLGPLQALGAGTQDMTQLFAPMSQLYAGARAPELQFLQALSGAGPLQKGFTTGLFGFGK